MSNIIKLNLNKNLVGGSIKIDNLKSKKNTNGVFDDNNYQKVKQDSYYQNGKRAYGDTFIEGVLPEMNVGGIRIGTGSINSYVDAGSIDRFWRPKIIDMDDALNETIKLSLDNYEKVNIAFDTQSDGTIKLKQDLLPDIREQPMELSGNTTIKVSGDNIITLEELNDKTNQITEKLNNIHLNKNTLIKLGDYDESIKLIDYINNTNGIISEIQSKLNPVNESQIEKIVEDLKNIKGSIVNINKIVDYLYERTR